MARSSPERFPPQLHASLALSIDSRRWYLVNATPDVRFQIESFPALHPGPSPRQTPICGVFLTDAELDHTLGLLILREGVSMDVYGSPVVLEALRDALPVQRLIMPYAQFRWLEVSPGEALRLEQSRLRVKAIRVGAKKPRYVRSAGRGGSTEEDWVIGYRFEDVASGGSLVYAPGVDHWTDTLESELRGADAILLDGTFWAQDEMAATTSVSGSAPAQIGHLPIGGPEGSAQRFRLLPAKHKIYVHVNNTNPVLDTSSEERRRLEDWGLRVASDGMELEV
jgi:pyrroloquinoline quinone biosynthesis protein B